MKLTPFLCALAALCLCATINAEEATQESPATEAIAEAPVPEVRVNNWYVGIGASNYYPGLKESEAKIDRQLNSIFGVLPSWKEPKTFKDWRDNCMLWDLTVGLGKDISPKTILMFWTGGAAATIKNKERYGPLATDIRFSRTSAFLIPEFFYYPLGKIDYEAVADKRGCERLRAALCAARPYLSVGSGYSFVRAEADAKFKLPWVGTIFRKTEKENHHMYTVSPRIGVEMPLGKNTSLTMAAIYYFFGPNHGSEYNCPSFSFSFHRKF